MTFADVNPLLALLLVLSITALFIIWNSPRMAESFAEILWKRACAKSAAQQIYAQVYAQEHLEDNVAETAKRAVGSRLEEMYGAPAKTDHLTGHYDYTVEQYSEKVSLPLSSFAEELSKLENKA